MNGTIEYFITATAVAILLTSASTASGQNRRERKSYEAAVEAATPESFRKYLSRYPDGHYAAEISGKLDSALNISTITAKKGEEILKTLIQSGVNDRVHAIGIRENGRDFIIGYEERNFSDKENILLLSTEKVNGFWQTPIRKKIGRYTLSENEVRTNSSGELELVKLDDGKYIKLAYSNFDEADYTCEYVETLIRCSDLDATNAIFRGRLLAGKKIEGRCPEALGENTNNPAMTYLLESFSKNSHLINISEADTQSDSAIEWWIKNNPEATTKSRTVKFGVLPEDCSLVKKFEDSDGKETCPGYSAALMEFRGYDIICAKNAENRHILVWCESLDKNLSKGRILNTIYFERGAILALFYYQGRNAFKYKINLNTKTISR